MRSNKELVKICLDNFNSYYNGFGLCLYFTFLKSNIIITQEECDTLMKLIRMYIKPKRWGVFDKRRVAGRNPFSRGGFWWDCKDAESRRQYLEYLLEKVK